MHVLYGCLSPTPIGDHGQLFRDHAQLHPAIKRDWMRVANLKSRSARQRGNNMLVPYQANLQKIKRSPPRKPSNGVAVISLLSWNSTSLRFHFLILKDKLFMTTSNYFSVL